MEPFYECILWLVNVSRIPAAHTGAGPKLVTGCLPTPSLAGAHSRQAGRFRIPVPQIGGSEATGLALW